ncbi:MAG: phosphate acyltransferase PlsX [Zetaproteobacteria bacterium]|nr:phosphate acyltransferase PlsX [Zetaproteobacteria bacterium]
MSTRILVDGHGGDHAPGVVIEALSKIIHQSSSKVTLGVVGVADILIPELEKWNIKGHVMLVEASDIVAMCDAPANALRRKRNSSMHVGAKCVRDGQWDAFVSAGNTGALMAISKLVLKTLPGVDRPAFASMIPSATGGTFFLDIGANVDSTAEHLFQFAVMGSCYLQVAEGIQSPRIGLLNIGSEDIKGTDVIKEAAERLRGSSLNFIGNVEGTNLFDGSVDVVVCDGFIGNVSLKTMEGVAKLIIQTLKKELTSSPVAKMGALLSKSALGRVRDAMNPSEHNGAPLLGLNGIVVKSHGSADAHAFTCAIDVARREVESNLLGTITESMATIHQSS